MTHHNGENHEDMPNATHRLQDIRDLIEADAWVLATQVCRRDVERLSLLQPDQRAMLLSLTEADHRGAWGTAASDYGPVDVDDYLLWYDEEAGVRCARNRGNCFYIKLGIHTDAQGSCVAVVSFHLDSRP